MGIMRKQPSLWIAGLAWGAMLSPNFATAQSYPAQAVRIVVGFPPGGTNDVLARLIAQRLSDKLGQPFIVENRPGAANNIGTEAVARAKPDGYTLLMANAPNAINHSLYEKLSFNFLTDIAPVAGIMRVPNVIVVNPSFEVKTLAELIAYTKANPGKVNMATPGIGSSTHVSMELLKMMSGIDLVHVPYRGSTPMITDLLGGQVVLGFDNLSGSIAHIRSGRLRALAVTTDKRSAVLPDVPTAAETVPGFEASAWFGLAAPQGTPSEVIDRLNKEVNAALADPKLQSQLVEMGGTLIPGTPADLGRLFADEVEKWRKVIKFSGARAQ
jgi:tripartite-type tricarboxylate transporter receptor subunit TctC